MKKPQEFTSFDVIGKLRGILHMRRLGHTGTLDPMATGVLPILVGSAAKACDILPNQDKCYVAQVQFGKASDTQDIWGTITQTYPNQHVTREALEGIFPEFTGNIMQLPPMYSSVSVGGKRLYELARKGIEIERERRPIQVYSIRLLQFNEAEQTAELEVACGKGTYIRTLLSDMGQRLGGDAVMTGLCRTMASGFTLEQCHDFEAVQQAMAENAIEKLLIPTASLFKSYPALHLNEVQTRMYRNGVKLDLSRLHHIQPDCTQYTVYGADGGFIGTATADHAAGLLRVWKNFTEEA